MKKILSIIAIFITLTATAQDFNEGYKMLETGKFAEGATFFKKYLDTHDAQNKTALLCYGRGVGLSSSPATAQDVFKKLLLTYPNDVEVQLNYAEAFMWNKQFTEALAYYQKLAVQYPKNFAVLIGSANAHSALLQFEASLQMAEKAALIDPNNAGLKITRKYGRLGWASQLSAQQGYDKALTLLESIYQDFPNDIDAGFLIAQVWTFKKEYKKAQPLFEKLLNSPKKTDAYLQLAYISFLLKDPKQALFLSQKAYLKAAEADKYKAKVGIINAMGWNSRFKEAFSLTEKLAKENPQNPDINLIKARLSVWSKQYQKGVEYYQKALKEDARSFDGNLGYGDARHAQGMDADAFEYAYRTLKIFPKQADAERFLEKLKLAHAPAIETQTFVSQDNGNNTSTNYVVQAGYDVHTQFRLMAAYRSRMAGNVANRNQADVQTITLGFKAKPVYFLGIEAEIGQMTSRTKVFNKNQLAYQVTTDWRLGRWQQLTLKYNREVQSFTAGLIENSLYQNNITANYSLTTPFNVGFYGQAIRTDFSDNNQRNLFFGSLYYDFVYQPVVKAGVNYQFMAFKKSKPTVYFSPLEYNGIEIFAHAQNWNMANQKFLYQVSLAGGTQFIEEKDAQFTYRFESMLGFRYAERLEFAAYFNRSNIATTSIMGYTYNELGIKAKWLILKKK